MSASTRVVQHVGYDRNGTSHIRVESLDEVSMNYITQPCGYGTMMTTTSGTAEADVVANVKH
jgi:hypothetical protein